MYVWRNKMRCSIHMLNLSFTHGMFICKFLANSYTYVYITSKSYIKESDFLKGNLNYEFIS